MRTPGFSLCCVGEDGTEDLFWFSHEAQVTEDTAREKFQHHAAMIPPEIGLKLYIADAPRGEKRLLSEKMPMRKQSAPSRSAR